MSIINPIKAVIMTAALVLGLSVFALTLGLFLAGFTPAHASEVKLSAGLGQSVISTKGG